MMHGHEKSDPAIVAMKPANKAARSATEPSVKEPAAAESVERRVGTKGNADWQSTRRTQSRVSVSQALERIRQMEADCSAVYTRGRSRMRESRLNDSETPRVHHASWRRGSGLATGGAGAAGAAGGGFAQPGLGR